MEYINTLPVWHLFILALTFVVGICNSLPNFLKYYLSFVSGKFKQSDLGKIIDWFWLASVLVLVTLYIRG